MKNRYLLISVILLVMLTICGIASYHVGWEKKSTDYDSYKEILESNFPYIGSTAHISDDYELDNDFISHLPLVIIDTNGVEPPINTRFKPYDESNPNEGIYVPIEGVEPYVDGTITIINDNDGMNSLNGFPEYVGNIRIKRRGNSSMSYEKAQWLIKLVTESGEEYESPLLGMGEEHEWVLNGSMTDKSLLRNYLAYSIASEFMPYTPDSRFCEVIIKQDDKYMYQGLYLLAENIRQGENRVNITAYDKKSTYNSYMLRRDRYDEEALMLDNYGRINGYSEEYLSVLYPSKNRISQEMLDYINYDINHIEAVLYSDDEELFATYPEVLNVDAFIDYFLVNEFFGNYDAGNNSTYMYKDVGGKLTIGPVWDYDGAMDNYTLEPFEAQAIAFQTKPWFDRLCLDKHFLKKLEKRYLELRRTSFSNDHVTDKIDEIVQYLDGAVGRDWLRWGHYYTEPNQYSLVDYKLDDGTLIHRNTVTYEDEIYKIKSTLREHSKYIYEDIRVLEKSAVFDTGVNSVMGWLLLLAAMIFIGPALVVNFRK